MAVRQQEEQNDKRTGQLIALEGKRFQLSELRKLGRDRSCQRIIDQKHTKMLVKWLNVCVRVCVRVCVCVCVRLCVCVCF